MRAKSDGSKNKFDTSELLKDKKPFLPLPKFILRMWREYYGTIPASFWISIIFILDATLGANAEGIEGDLAQSQVPVDHKEFARVKAALTGWGWDRLVEIEKSDGSKGDFDYGSTFRLNPSATEEDWLDFVEYVRLAYRDGILSRDNSILEIEGAFAKAEMARPRVCQHLWSEIMLRMVSDENSKAITDPVDVWDEKNWIARGFDWRWIYKEVPYKEWPVMENGRRMHPSIPNEQFDGLAIDTGENELLCWLWHLAWTHSREEDEAPLIPDDVEQLKSVFKNWSKYPDEAWAGVLSKFKKVEHPEWGPALQHEWLTSMWKQAKWEHSTKVAEINAALDAAPRSDLPEKIAAWRGKILSRPKEKKDGA